MMGRYERRSERDEKFKEEFGKGDMVLPGGIDCDYSTYLLNS
jgi:hypothetical protein